MLPDPLSPPDCDLRGYDFMPLFGHRAFRSKWYSLALKNPRAGLAAQKLWWEAWQQCPAGSLPNDDDDLARMADFGADLKSWAKVKAVALHGFIECSDGRLYHPVLCTEAQLAFERRIKERERKAQQRAKKRGTNDGSPQDVPRDTPETETGQSAGQPEDVPVDRTGQGQDRTDKKEEPLPSVEDAAPASSPDDPRTMLFRTGLQKLVGMTGLPEPRARTQIGQWLKAASDDAALVLLVIEDAVQSRPASAIPWIVKAIQFRAQQQKAPVFQRPEPESRGTRLMREMAELDRREAAERNNETMLRLQ